MICCGNMLKIGMLFSHDFYEDSSCHGFDSFLRRKRRKSTAVFQIYKIVKPGLYAVRCIDIQSNEDFIWMGYTGGVHHQYHIGDIFLIRKHKQTNKWFDVRHPGLDYTENFILL